MESSPASGSTSAIEFTFRNRSPFSSSSSPQDEAQLNTVDPLASCTTAQIGARRQRSTLTGPCSSNPSGPRIRPKIALDPEQPLTALGKPRARVYVACNQCRTRKTRCDGAKPVCYHCRKRPTENGVPCIYEDQPKRRGQDKKPGRRVRESAKSKPAFRKDVDPSDPESSCCRITSIPDHSEPIQLHASCENCPEPLDDVLLEHDPFAGDPSTTFTPPSANVELDLSIRGEETDAIPARPSLQFTRETWWDALLSFYASEDSGHPVETFSLTAEQRSTTMRHIVADLRALFHSSLYWVSFLNIPRFFDDFLNPTRRTSLQPSLILSAIALGTLSQSSEAENGAPGRLRALKLLDLADSALQGSLASGWVDIGLVQASWLILYFELQSHPLQSAERNRSSLLLVDSLIRLFSLTTLDADLKGLPSTSPFANASQPDNFMYTSGSDSCAQPITTVGIPETNVPILSPNQPQNTAIADQHPVPRPLVTPLVAPLVPDNTALAPTTSPQPSRCNCAAFTISPNWPSVMGLAPSWIGTLMWPTGLSESDFRKEECRRLVWASVMLTASLNSYDSVIRDVGYTGLFIQDPRNYALMFPGESLAMTRAPVQPNNVWTLYLRAMLLIHSCVRVRADRNLDDAQRAHFAMKAWLEIDAIEDALDQHTCGLERNFGFQAREVLFRCVVLRFITPRLLDRLSSRMCVSHEFQRYIPQATTRLFYRDKAEDWLKHRMAAAERVWRQLMEGQQVPKLDCRKPLLIYWFISHVVKALALWRADPTLTIALTASKTFVKRAEYLMMFWPSPAQRQQWQELRYHLVEACLEAGIAPPEPSIPAPFPYKKTV
ncbi:hypothetical protein BD414DRAFT_226070 [Trametes punicea]|nr:hypothetical protein BD414DRAFT_226070 [Trametes punicea]